MSISFAQVHVEAEPYDHDPHAGYICDNDWVVVSVECRNDGDEAVAELRVSLRIDGDMAQETQIDGLEPGEAKWAQWRHEAVSAGYHNAWIESETAQHNESFVVLPDQHTGIQM